MPSGSSTQPLVSEQARTLAAKLGDLLDGVDGHVAGAVHDDVLALEGIAVALQVLVDEVHQAVAGGLGAGERSRRRTGPCR